MGHQTLKHTEGERERARSDHCQTMVVKTTIPLQFDQTLILLCLSSKIYFSLRDHLNKNY